MTENDLLYGSSFFIQDVLERAADGFTNRAYEKGLEFIIDVGPEANLEVRGSENTLQRILEHLLGNAIQYTERGEIIVSAGVADASRASATIRFDVKDSGAGVFSEPQLAVLNPNFSASASGFALMDLPENGGLLQAQELIACLGGKLSVWCEPGAGSVFSFAVPFDVVIRKSYGTEEAADEWAEDFRVLLAEDHEVTRRLLCAKLRQAKINVVSAENFEELVQQIEDASAGNHPFSVIIADSDLPTNDGSRVDLALSERFGSMTLPMVLLNGAAQEPGEDRVAGESATAQVGKPVKQTELWRAIRSCIVS